MEKVRSRRDRIPPRETDALWELKTPGERPRVTWPGGKPLAVPVICNVEVHDLFSVIAQGTAVIPVPRDRTQPDLANFTWREFGLRVGIWRLFELLDRFGMPISCQFNSDIIARYPQVAEAIKIRGWEIVAHSTEQTRPPLLWFDDPDAERAEIRATVGACEAYFGKRPKGWLSPGGWPSLNTPRLIAEEGLIWIADYMNDNQPYLIEAGDKHIVSIPYETDVNDYSMAVGLRTADAYYRSVMDSFETLYREGERSARFLPISFHPHILGRPYWISAIERILEDLQAYDGIWWTTRDDMAEWYLAHVEA